MNDYLDYSIEFSYSFKSGLGCYEESRFIKEHRQKINFVNEDERFVDGIGEINFLMI